MQMKTPRLSDDTGGMRLPWLPFGEGSSDPNSTVVSLLLQVHTLLLAGCCGRRDDADRTNTRGWGCYGNMQTWLPEYRCVLLVDVSVDVIDLIVEQQLDYHHGSDVAQRQFVGFI